MIPKGGIAFFDSGIGGLTVLEECRKYLPKELFYYYGDNSYAPYGNRPTKVIIKRVKKAMRLFSRLKVKAVVLACNTATAVCIDKLRKKYSFPIIGTEPAVQLGARMGGEVFVLVTKATHQSQRFHSLCKIVTEKYPQAKIRAFACEHLAGAIEKNIATGNFDYDRYLPNGRPNVVVLGCTHYVYIKRQIAEKYHCITVDGNEGVARRLQAVLKNNKNIRARTCKMSKNSFLQPFLTTTRKKRKGVNKRLPKKDKNCLKNEGGVNVLFVGKTKGFNAKAHKQMFGFAKNGRKYIFSGQKNKKN